MPTGPRRTRAVLNVLAVHFTSPVFTAALELWVAARTDRALLAAVAPLEQEVGRETHRLTVEALGADERTAGVRELMQATLDLVRGLGLANTITDDARRRGRILDQWARTLDGALGGIRVSDLLDGVLADLRAESDQLWAAVSGLDDAGWRTPTPAEGWDVATQIAHLTWTDEVAVLAATDQAAWDAVVTDALADPDGYVDTAARAIAALVPQALLARWGAAREALTTTLRDYPARRADAVVRTADVAGLDGDGAPHGDLGARPRRRRRPRRHPEPTDRMRHVAHLGVRTRDFSFVAHGWTRPPEEFRVADGPVGRAWSWGPARRRQRCAARRSTSACWSPSAPTAPTPTSRPPVPTPTAGSTSPRLRRPAGHRGGRPRSSALSIGNCSGFYGDRLSAMREMLDRRRRSTCSPATTSPS